MNIIICLDDKNGILFNSRRQSRDKALLERVRELSKSSVLWMTEYSSELFASDTVKVDSEFLKKARKGDFCFTESDEFLQYDKKIEKIIVYRWNKVYPSDVKVDAAFFSKRTCIKTTDFKGNSHEKITEEIYE